MNEHRNFGFSEERDMFYTAQDFKDGCSFNYWMGVSAGIIGTLTFSAFMAWVLGII
jgi:hypothetical protein